MGHPQINQPGLLASIYNVNRGIHYLLGRIYKSLSIFCAPQCVGAHNTYFLGRSAVYELLKTFETSQASGNRRGSEHARVIGFA